MKRAYYLAGWGYAVICIAYFLKATGGFAVETRWTEPAAGSIVYETSPGGRWYGRTKARCNALEVDLALRSDPPPPGADGAAYRAACLAVAGRIDDAREAILGLPASERAAAAGVVFGVGHPIADAGDDRSAGPIMQLVVEFQPDNVMALYHAGMSWYILGRHDLAERHLRDFVRVYGVADGWRSNALQVLRRLDAEAGR